MMTNKKYADLKKFGIRPMFSETEEKELFSIFHSCAGKEAVQTEIKDILVRAYLPFISKFAAKFAWCSIDIEDLIQEGSIGLIDAINHYDPKKYSRFSTYAGTWIRKRIWMAVHKYGSLIRIPTHENEKILKLKKIKDNFVNTYGREPELHELSDLTNFSIDKICELQRFIFTYTSHDHVFHNVA